MGARPLIARTDYGHDDRPPAVNRVSTLVRFALGHKIRARFRLPTFYLPLEGRQEYAFGRSRLEASAGTLMFLPQGTEATRRSAGGTMLAIEIETGALSIEL